MVFGPLPVALRQTVGRFQHVFGPAAGDEIGLLPEIEVWVRRPVGVLESVVAGVRLGDGFGRIAHHPHQRVVPDRSIIAHQLRLTFGELGRIVRHPVSNQFVQRFRCVLDFAGGRERRLLVVGPVHEVAHHFAGAFKELQHILGELVGIRDLIVAQIHPAAVCFVVHGRCSPSSLEPPDPGVAGPAGLNRLAENLRIT